MRYRNVEMCTSEILWVYQHGLTKIFKLKSVTSTHCSTAWSIWVDGHKQWCVWHWDLPAMLSFASLVRDSAHRASMPGLHAGSSWRSARTCRQSALKNQVGHIGLLSLHPNPLLVIESEGKSAGPWECRLGWLWSSGNQALRSLLRNGFLMAHYSHNARWCLGCSHWVCCIIPLQMPPAQTWRRWFIHNKPKEHETQTVSVSWLGFVIWYLSVNLRSQCCIAAQL